MTWQATFILCLYVGWTGLHWWLGKQQIGVVLWPLIVAEVLGFVGTWLWITSQDYHASAGMAVGLVIFGAAAILILPVLIGLLSHFKHRTRSLLVEDEKNKK